KFFARAAASASALAMETYLPGFSQKPEKPQPLEGNVIKEVLKYRKIDSHAHVFFTEDSPETQIDFADRLGIERLVISRPMAPGSAGKPEEFISSNNLVTEAVREYTNTYI